MLRPCHCMPRASEPSAPPMMLSAVVKRKVGVQKFIRRGDRFDPTQAEFQFDDNPKWEYQPDKEKKAQ